MLKIAYNDRMTNIWVGERTDVVDILSNVIKRSCHWQGTSTASKTTDGPRVSSLGDHTTRTYDKGDQANDEQILKRHDLTEDCARRANLEALC